MDTKSKVLDIAMNLNRIGNWAADDYKGKEKRIDFFLDQTNQYIKSLDKNAFSSKFKDTFDSFYKYYQRLLKDKEKGPKDTLFWAEMMMTWGNILTHRAKLI